MIYYKLIDIGKKKTYVFLPVLNNSDTIINKLFQKKSLSLNEKTTFRTQYLGDIGNSIITKLENKTPLNDKEKDYVKENYNNIKTIQNIENYNIIKTAVYDDDTIEIIRKKIMINLVYDLNKILLFCNSSTPSWKLSNRIKNRILYDREGPSNIKYSANELNKKNRLEINIKSVDLILGHEFYNKNGIRTFNCDLINNDLSSIKINFNDILNYTDDILLSEYSTIKNNTIYCIYYDDYLKKYENNETLTSIFYPKLNYEIISDNYKELIQKYDDVLLYINNPNNNNQYKLNEVKIRNLVIYSNENNNNNIDLESIFNNLVLDDTIVFIKYKTPQKKNIFKINYNSVVLSYNGKSIKKTLANLEKYIVPYIFNYYKPDITYEMLNDWKNNKMTLNERIDAKNENKMNIKIKNLNLAKSSITLKLKYNNLNDFITVLIHNDGKIDIKLLDGNVFNILEIDLIIKFINSKLKKLGNVPQLLNKNYNIINFDGFTTFEVDKTKNFNLKRMESEIIKAYAFAYITYDETNNLIIKYKRVNKFNSFDNYKNYFFKLRKLLKSKSVSEFRKQWLESTQVVFNLSESESLQKYEEISDKIEIEDLKRESPEAEITVVISLYETTETNNVYNVEIKTCKDMELLDKVTHFIESIITKCIEDTTSASKKEDKTSTIKIKEVSKKELINEDDFDFDDEFEEESDNEDIEEPIIAEVEVTESPNVEVKLEPIKLQNISIRKYMGDMRKRYDNKLYNYKTTTLYEQYSRNCGSADMRQPIIINEKEWNNAFKLDKESMSELSYLRWGSSQSSLNYYICPRIWCLRDKVAILAKKFLDNNEKCPHCMGEVIDLKSKTIGGNKTVIIRKGGANNYWENLKTRNTFKQSDQWKKSILKGTEKDSYPGLLDPKLHPQEMCMPCCNTIGEDGGKTYKNFEKCLNIVVRACNYVPLTSDNKYRRSTNTNTIFSQLKAETYIPPYDYSLKEGIIIDNIKLIVGDKVLLVDQLDSSETLYYGIFEITLNGFKKITNFTYLNLELQLGLTITVTDGDKNNNKIFIIKKNKVGNFIVDNFRDEKSSKYKSYEKQFNKNIINKEKIPIYSENKYGFLEPILDKLLGNNLKNSLKTKSTREKDVESILSNRIDIGKSLYLRKGLDHNKKFSFISAMASYKKLPVLDFINLIVENLDPEIFCGLNGGDLLKMFSDDPLNLIKNGHQRIFIKWCVKYERFIVKMGLVNILSYIKEIEPIKKLIQKYELQLYFIKLKRKTSSNNLKDEWIKTAQTRFKISEKEAELIYNNISQSNINYNDVLKELKTNNANLFRIVNKFNVELEELIKTNKDVYKVVMIFYGFEYFKKYCGDMNVYKDYKLFWGLFSTPLNWLFEKGLNIFIINIKDNKVHLDCPMLEDTSILYKTTAKNVLLIRQDSDSDEIEEYLFEPIVKVIEGELDLDIDLSKDKYTEELFIDNLFANKLVYSLKNYCGASKSDKFGYTQLLKYDMIESLQKIDKNYQIDSQILDEFMKSIGIMTKNGFIIYTRPFGIKTGLPIITLDPSQKYSLETLQKHFNFINTNLKNIDMQITKYLVDKYKIHGVITNYGTIYNIEETSLENIAEEMIIQTRSKYGVVLSNFIEDDRIKLIKKMNNDMQLGNHIRKEISAFFKYNNKNRWIIKKNIINILDNPIDIMNHKRNDVQSILKNIIDNIIQIVPNKELNLDTSRACSAINYKRCDNLDKCMLIDSGSPKKDKIMGNIIGVRVLEGETIIDSNSVKGIMVGDVIRFINNGNYYKKGRKFKIIRIDGTNLVIMGNYGDIEIDGQWEYTSVSDNYYSKCKMIVNNRDELDKHMALIIEELLNSYVKRMVILNGDYMDIETIIDDNTKPNMIYMDDESYDNKIIDISNKNRNIYINQLFTKHNLIIDYNNRINKIILNKHIPANILTKKVQKKMLIKKNKKENSVNDTGTIMASTLNWKGVDKKSEKVKSGPCKFPYKTKRIIKDSNGNKRVQYLSKNECIKKEDGLMCPVELHNSGSNVGQGKVWGYCPKHEGSLVAQVAKSASNIKEKKESPVTPSKVKSSGKCKPIDEYILTELIKNDNELGGERGEWVGPLEETYIPESLFSRTYSNNENEAKRLCQKEPNCIGITKKKKWSLRKGLELCHSKDEISYVKRDKYKLLKTNKPKTQKRKLIVKNSN
jgi:hypothetical protein